MRPDLGLFFVPDLDVRRRAADAGTVEALERAATIYVADIMRLSGEDGAAVYATLRERAASLRTSLPPAAPRKPMLRPNT